MTQQRHKGPSSIIRQYLPYITSP